MINYVIIYDKKIRVHLKCKVNDCYKVKFNDHTLSMDIVEECMWAFYVYYGPLSRLSNQLRSCFSDSTLTESDILEFRDVFKEEHKTEPCRCKIYEIPAITQNDDEYLKLGEGYFKQPVYLSHKHEQLALEILFGDHANHYDSCSEDAFVSEKAVGIYGIRNAFERYCSDFSIRMNRGESTIDKAYVLAMCFLEVHGLDKTDVSSSFYIIRKACFDFKKLIKIYFKYNLPTAILIMAYVYSHSYFSLQYAVWYTFLISICLFTLSWLILWNRRTSI